jgi:hypothetical protein
MVACSWGKNCSQNTFLSKHAAFVRWFLSIDAADLPESSRQACGDSFRRMVIDDEELNLSQGFADLHTRAYEEILAGRGFGIDDVRPSIVLADRIRLAGRQCAQTPVTPHGTATPRTAML